MSGRNKDGVRMRGWFGVLFLCPCEDACGRGLSIGIRGKYDMGNEVKWVFVISGKLKIHDQGSYEFKTLKIIMCQTLPLSGTDGTGVIVSAGVICLFHHCHYIRCISMFKVCTPL